ncbi:MAG TPA: VOC family protein [Dehalococcoidia bacterium]|nr:VOC family protein [Dehalococcoidia bacterium]
MSDGTTAQADNGVEAQLARHGKLSYLQIPALDVDRSAAFYTAVFGWSSRDDQNASHRSFGDTTGDLIGAFVTGHAISREPGVLPYIYVDRIGDTIATIEANGGEVVRAPSPEGDLWVATFRDPAGNVIGVWQAGPR